MTPVITDYPVFEADQVLSQKHLNKLISYLEEQDRISRVALLGMGIVCGLDIKRPNARTVDIGCGTAITSLGFLIPFKDSRYTHFKATTISEYFLHPDLEKHPYLETMYDYAKLYEPFENCLELLPSDSEDDGKEILTQDILDDKVIMLLLEAPLIDEKNCVAIDCADKGKRLEFKARPLLIDREELEDSAIRLNQCQNTYFAKKVLPKYNVPRTNLVTGQHVLEAFNLQINKSKQILHDAIKSVHDHYQQELGDVSNYSRLSNVLAQVNTLHAQYRNDIYIQYVVDWIGDLLATYHEIAKFNTCNPSICCPNNDLFPFHVLLGLAEFETQDIGTENDLYRFRTPFIKTGILAEEYKVKKEELKGLIHKLIHQLSFFDIHLKTVRLDGIKITPSRLGTEPLSERAIPYYYGNIKDMVGKWSPILKMKGLHQHILSYHSKLYNDTDDHVNNPLGYDSEPFNFYRIEGHIGKNYNEALATVIAQVNKNRLPFKVIALNASDYLKKTVDISKHKGDWNDLELDYDMARKKVFSITEYVINWVKRNKTEIQENYILITDNVVDNLSNILAETRELLSDNLQEFLFNYKDFYDVFRALNRLFVSHRRCLLLQKPEDFSRIEEDLIDHFDEINSLFLEDPFTVIVEEAHRRWKEQYKNLFLSKFLESHPGIEHKAGVPKGGTFIMLYTDSSIFAKPKFINPTTLNLLETINIYQASLFDNAEVEIAENITFNQYVKPFIVNPKDDKPEDECTKEVERVKGNLLENAKLNLPANIPLSVRDYLFDNIKDVFDLNPEVLPNNNKIPERVVIADFYLPYICCGNGDTINIALPPNDENQTIIADFDHRDFSDDDFFTNKPE
ncbi:hypothetical protein [uncultured Psychroserpens sp.]|uniref:hypothetical protein n=1 Tax=uncultured Psychroserpens sp. TaxID=255436 RepID=UPI0026197A28|nr:hypothetical protein [uncultured Psychroserpens sp.]